MAKSSESPIDKVWKFFTSLRLAIPLIIILASTSIIGTIIEQNQPIEKYRQFYSEGTIKFLSKIGLFDMYHSWWFLLLLVFFTVNLTCCTIDRLPNVFKIIKNPRKTLEGGMEKSLSLSRRWKRKGTVASLAEQYSLSLKSAFKEPEKTNREGTLHLYAEKGAFSRFGVYITHLSILIILAGAISGNIWGFKGYVNIVEGSEVGSVQTRGARGIVDLGFLVKCNKFWVEYYPNGAPKEYFSDLTVIEDGKVVKQERIEVNSPLRHNGIWFYQSSYGPAGASNIAVDVKDGSGAVIRSLTLLPNKKVDVEGLGKVSAIDYNPNKEGFGPALLVSLEEKKGSNKNFWLFKNFPDFDKRRGGDRYLAFKDLNTIYYTGLQVARDPGVNIVWLGCALMVVGILIAFFGSHRRVWLKLSDTGDGRVEMVLAGSANKNRLAFEKKFAMIGEEVSGDRK